jgi:hypothetical protein
VTACLPCGGVPKLTQSPDQLCAGQLTRQSHLSLRGQQLIANEVQPDDFGRHAFVKVAMHRGLHSSAQFRLGISFRKNGFPQRTGNEAPFGSLFNSQKQFRSS